MSDMNVENSSGSQADVINATQNGNAPQNGIPEESPVCKGVVSDSEHADEPKEDDDATAAGILEASNGILPGNDKLSTSGINGDKGVPEHSEAVIEPNNASEIVGEAADNEESSSSAQLLDNGDAVKPKDAVKPNGVEQHKTPNDDIVKKAADVDNSCPVGESYPSTINGVKDDNEKPVISLVPCGIESSQQQKGMDIDFEKEDGDSQTIDESSLSENNINQEQTEQTKVDTAEPIVVDELEKTIAESAKEEIKHKSSDVAQELPNSNAIDKEGVVEESKDAEKPNIDKTNVDKHADVEKTEAPVEPMDIDPLVESNDINEKEEAEVTKITNSAAPSEEVDNKVGKKKAVTTYKPIDVNPSMELADNSDDEIIDVVTVDSPCKLADEEGKDVPVTTEEPIAGNESMESTGRNAENGTQVSDNVDNADFVADNPDDALKPEDATEPLDDSQSGEPATLEPIVDNIDADKSAESLRTDEQRKEPESNDAEIKPEEGSSQKVEESSSSDKTDREKADKDEASAKPEIVPKREEQYYDDVPIEDAMLLIGSPVIEGSSTVRMANMGNDAMGESEDYRSTENENAGRKEKEPKTVEDIEGISVFGRGNKFNRDAQRKRGYVGIRSNPYPSSEYAEGASTSSASSSSYGSSSCSNYSAYGYPSDRGESSSRWNKRIENIKKPGNRDQLKICIPDERYSRKDRFLEDDSGAGCSSDYGLMADYGRFVDDDEPGPSNRGASSSSKTRPRRKGPRTPSNSPPFSPPHAAYIDADFRLALALQEEENRKARYSRDQDRDQPSTSYQSSSSHHQGVYVQHALSPRFSDDVQFIEQEDNPDTVEQAYALYKECKQKFPKELLPEPFKIDGFNAQQLCEGYKDVLRGNCFPYDGAFPPVPPGSPKIPEQTHVSYRSTPFRIVNDPVHQNLPTDMEQEDQSAFQKLVVSTEDRMNRFSRSATPPRSSRRRTPIDDYEDDSQPGPSNRRPVYHVINDDEDEDLKQALELSRIEHENMLRRQAGLPEKNAAGTSSDDGLFRVPAPRKRKIPLSENHEMIPLARRAPTQAFYTEETVYDVDEPEISSTTTYSNNKWPLCKWLDPEKMAPLNTIDYEEQRKMPPTYLHVIGMEQLAQKIKSRDEPQIAKHQFEIDFEREEEEEKRQLEEKFITIARSHITSPNIVPSEVTNTRFEVYVRFPFLRRPIFVHEVLVALLIPDNRRNPDEKLLDEMPDEIREMSVGEFFKHAVYIWMGLKLNYTQSDRPLSDETIYSAKQSFYESMRTRLDDEAQLQEDEEERKCAESMAVSYVHSCGLKEVNREDVAEMQKFKTKCITDKKLQLTRHKARYGNPFTQADLEIAFRKPACIQREEESLQSAQAEREKMEDSSPTADENEAPLRGEVDQSNPREAFPESDDASMSEYQIEDVETSNGQELLEDLATENVNDN